MSAKLLLGKPCVDSMREKILNEVKSLDCRLKLCTVGFNEPRWEQYSVSLSKSAVNYGFECENIVADEGISADDFCNVVKSACARSDVGGVILQQPLPKEYDLSLEHVAVAKDVDCLNPLSVANMYKGDSGFSPATPLAVLKLLDFYDIDLRGKNVVIVGRGNAVGKPLSLLMLRRDATVTVCHTKTVNLSSVCRGADVLVSACGAAGLITSDYVTEKSIVIDVGLSFVNGKTNGDVASEAYEKCLAVSPVPGGIGPITRACLFENLLQACKGVK